GGGVSTTNIYPIANNTYDLGSYGAAWKDVYVSGTIYTSTTQFAKGGAAVPTITFQGDADTGLYSAGANQIGFASGTLAQGNFYADMTAATGNETAYRFSYTTNKAAGNDYGLVVNQTDTSSPGTSYLMDLQRNGVSAFQVWNNGYTLSSYVMEATTLYAGSGLVGASISNYPLRLQGYDLDDANAIAVKVGNAVALTTAGGKIMAFYSDAMSTEKAYFDINGGLYFASSTVPSAFTWSGNLKAGTNNAFDLGAYGNAWKDIYSSGTIYANNLSVAGLQIQGGHLIPNTNNAYNLGAPTSSWKYLYVSSTAYLGGGVSTTNIFPIANNSYDLGSFTAAWKDIYASGTYYHAYSTSAAYVGVGTSTFKGSPSVDAAGNTAFVFDTNAAVSNANLWSLRNNGNTKAYFDTNGTLNLIGLPSPYTGAWINFYYDTGSLHTSYKSENSSGGFVIENNSSVADNSFTLKLTGGQSSNEADYGFLKLLPIYNRTAGDGGNDTDFLINRTETLIATGSQKFADFRVGNVSRFFIDNLGNISTSGSLRSTHLIPQANNSYNIGAPTSSWKDVYVSGTVYTSTTQFAKGGLAVPSITFQGDSDTGIFSSAANTIDFGVSGNRTQLQLSPAAFTVGDLIRPNANNAHSLGLFGAAFMHVVASGTVYASNIITAGNVTSTGHIYPNQNNTANLGSADYSFKDLYASGTSYFGGTLTPKANNSVDLGAYTTAWKDIYSSGTIYANNLNVAGLQIQGGHLIPNANNAYNLGAPTSSWKYLYVSSTAYLGGGVSTTNIYPI
ncbi:MAG: hypothetical protein AB1772_13345, partial [Candidatus Zixiibacteriota bacterium]